MTTGSTSLRSSLRLPESRAAWAALILLPSTILWAAILFFYVASPIYAGHAESTVTIIAQQWLHGRPMYHSTDSAYLYSVLYGPSCFLSLSCWLRLIPDPVLASKLGGAFWTFVSGVSLYYACWKRFGIAPAIAALGTVATSYFISQSNLAVLATIWDRSDTILIAATALGLAALAVERRGFANTLLILALALAVDAKIHGFLYLLPIWAVWLRRHGFRSLLTGLILGGLLALTPFLLRGISLGGYLTWLRMATVHPLRTAVLAENLTAYLPLLAPLAFLPRSFPRGLPWRGPDEINLLLLVLIPAGLLVCIPASKMGAGPTHLLPFAPYIGYLVASSLQDQQGSRAASWGLALAFVWVAISGPLGLLKARDLWRLCHDQAALAADRDLRSILVRYDPRQMQMGVGDPASYPSTYCAPRLYHFGATRVADYASCMDMSLSGLSLDPLARSLRKREFKWWLIPHGDQPFSMIIFYTGKPMFDEATRQAFLENYALAESTQSWDVYEARSALP